MPEKPTDLYSTFGGVPADDVAENGTGASSINVKADPDAFGAQVGAAEQNQGKTISAVADQASAMATDFAQRATEAKVNDDYANKYAPAAADLRNQYDQLQGQDKVHGYDSYIGSLQALNRQFTAQSPGAYGQHLMSGLIDRHVAGEIDGAKRELVQSQLQFANQAATDKVMADSGYAVANYNNPELVGNVIKSNDATIALTHIDGGYDPADPAHQAVIQQAQNDATGKMAVDMVSRALASGDAAGANDVMQTYGKSIPGYQQLAIEKTLHAENMRQLSVNGTAALAAGRPIPQSVGSPPAQVQGVVADTAQKNGVDINSALTVLRIESRYGQNVGTRGDIGQTGKGGDLPTQATNMINAWKDAGTQTTIALGRAPQPWEQYATYQQGSGAGPALLRADSNTRAIDVLTPVYKGDAKKAAAAITSNGGNLSMSAGDFLGHIQKTYADNASRAAVEIPQTTTVSSETQTKLPDVTESFIAPHTQYGPAVQPAASPRETLDNFDQKYPDMVARAQALPNLAQRAAVLTGLNQHREQLAGAATAYSNQLVTQAQKLAVDPTFTDMSQVPAEMAASLQQEHPQTLAYLEHRAEDNLAKSSGGNGKDMKTYGPKVIPLMNDVLSGKIKGPVELMAHVNNGDITLAGFDRLEKEITHDPESQAEATMKAQTLKVIKRQLSGEDDDLGLKDPKGEELYAAALPKVFKAIEDGKAKGLSAADLYDPTSINWVGKSAQSLKRSLTQMNMDMLNSTGDNSAVASATPAAAPAQRNFATIYREYQAATDPHKKAALMQEARAKGFLHKTPSAIPSAPAATE